MSAGAGAEAARVQRLVAALRERELDALLVAAPINLRYVSGFTGSNGLALIAAGEGESTASSRTFATRSSRLSRSRRRSSARSSRAA